MIHLGIHSLPLFLTVVYLFVNSDSFIVYLGAPTNSIR